MLALEATAAKVTPLMVFCGELLPLKGEDVGITVGSAEKKTCDIDTLVYIVSSDARLAARAPVKVLAEICAVNESKAVLAVRYFNDCRTIVKFQNTLNVLD